ncbi:unnamed protein product [Dimorphilus gyrociliatus]|uniref:Nucleotide-diphospho-sugar transferase domain-containing protein n=1 Tax=Dimorphilus gyrociliatus TaxID=2664684 RepID=A0A7I8VY06_9ANNE|nr:unnamed protein product [Dimorphilus gyrociliatus]
MQLTFFTQMFKRILRAPKLAALVTCIFFVAENFTELAIRYVPEINRLKKGIENCDRIPRINTFSIMCPFDNPGELTTNDTIILTYANSGWSQQVTNWICNAKKANISKLLVIAVNNDLCDKIGNIPGVKCWTPSLSPTFRSLREKALSDKVKENNVQNSFNASSNAEWGTENYGLLLKYRTLIIYSILKCGYPILLSDTDVIFLKSPLNYLQQLTHDNTSKADALNPRYEMIFQKDATGWRRFDSWGLKGWFGNWYACAGFAYIIPTPGIIKFWEGMVAFQESDWNDQVGVNLCLRYSSHRVRWMTLDSDLFPNGRMIQDGYRYNGKEYQSQAISQQNPYVIHFNWIHEFQGKIKYMKLMKLWCG